MSLMCSVRTCGALPCHGGESRGSGSNAPGSVPRANSSLASTNVSTIYIYINIYNIYIIYIYLDPMRQDLSRARTRFWHPRTFPLCVCECVYIYIMCACVRVHVYLGEGRDLLGHVLGIRQ